MKSFWLLKVVILTLLGVHILSCESPSDQEDYFCQESLLAQKEAIRAITLDCMPAVADVASFTGLLNGQLVCYYAGEKGYDSRTLRFNQTITPGPTLRLEDTTLRSRRYLMFGVMQVPASNIALNLQEYIAVQTPLTATTLSWADIARKWLKKGPLPLQSEQIGEEDGFNVVLEVHYQRGNEKRHFVTQTLHGKQDDSRLEIVALEYEEAFGWGHYHIVMEIECNLYMGSCQIGVAGRRAFRLTQGRLEMVVSVPL